MKQFISFREGWRFEERGIFFSILRCSEASKRWRLTGWKLWCSGWVVDGAQEGKRTRGQGDYGGQGDAAEAKTWCFVTVDSPTRPPPTPLLPQIPFCSSSVTSLSRSSPPLPDPPRPQLIFHPQTPPLSPNCPLLLVIILFCIVLDMMDKVSRKVKIVEQDYTKRTLFNS